MACLCGHARIRHKQDQGGRCTAMGKKSGTLCFCNTYTSELEADRMVRL